MDKDGVGREVAVIIDDIGKIGGCLTALTRWRDKKAIFRGLICGEDVCRTAADGVDNRPISKCAIIRGDPEVVFTILCKTWASMLYLLPTPLVRQERRHCRCSVAVGFQ